MRRALLLGLLLTGGCKRDPQWFGIWEITELERDGVRQGDAGFFEIMDDGSIALFLRYRWNGSDFEPDAHPEVEMGTTDAHTQDDVVKAYKQKGEVYTLYLSPFDQEFAVDRYTGDRGVLTGKDAIWPGRPDTERLPLELSVRR